MSTEKPRFTITVDDELFELIEDFRFENRYPNRNVAINALLLAGAEALLKKKPTGQGGQEERDEEREVHQREETKNDDLVGR